MLVALPSSIAFGVVVFSALGPENAAQGALAGILGAGLLGIVAPLVSRNGGFITAPCAPAAAVMSALAADLARKGTPLEPAVAEMALVGLVAGVLQLLFGALRAGRLMKYIPYQVVSGYLSGVALIIALGQLPRLLGLPRGEPLLAGILAPARWTGPALVVGVTTILAMVVARRITEKVPAPVVGLLGGVAAYSVLAVFQPELRTVVDNPQVVGPLAVSGSLAGLVLERLRQVALLGGVDPAVVISNALTLAVLLSVDTLKTGIVLDALTRRRHNSNRELLGQGTANLVSAFAGGIPGAGTMGATLVNVSSGGRTPLSGVVAGALCLLALMMLSPLVAFVPVAALAGILLVVAWRMFDFTVFRLLARPGTRLDFVVIAAVIASALALGLIQASLVGVSLASLLFIRDQVRSDVILGKSDLRQTGSKWRRRPAERALLAQHGDEALLVRLQGNLFFGTTDQLFSELEQDLARRRFLLLDLRRVQSMDYTAGHLFGQMQARLAERGGRLLLSGMPSGLLGGRDIEDYLSQLGLLNQKDGPRVFQTRDAALEWMEDRVLENAGWQPPPGEAPLEAQTVEILRDLDRQALDELRDALEERSFSAGQRIFSSGDPGDELFLVRRGRVHVLVPLTGGLRHHLATFCRGEFFGELSFLDRRERSADAEAVTQADLFVLARERFDRVAAAHPQVSGRIFHSLAKAISQRLRLADVELRALEER